MRISWKPYPVNIMINQEQMDNVECLNCFGSMITNDARYMCEIKSKIAMTKAAFNSFPQQIGLKFKEESVEMLH
jgi:hypothetical protein